MPNFVIYKYDFKEGEKTLLSPDTGRSALEEAQAHFAKLLGGKQMNLYRMKKNAIAAHKIRRVFQSLAVK
jgi:hypothetical protein